MSSLAHASILPILRDEPPAQVPLGVTRRALVALDRSARSEASLPLAALVARVLGAKLTLAHVVPTTLGSAATRTGALDWEIRRREADHYLERVRGSLGDDGALEVELRATQGVPGLRLLALASEIGADLTVVAGREDGAGALGSVAQQVIAGTRGSLLVAHPLASWPPRRIVVPLDGSARTEAVLPTVVALARATHAEVTLLHVVSDRARSAVLAGPAELELAHALTRRLRKNAESYLERLRQRELRDVVVVHRVVRAGDEDRRALAAALGELDADLVVLAAHGATCDLRDPFGSVASHLLTHVRRSMLVLQDAEAGAAPVVELPVTHRRSGTHRREDA